MEWIRSRPNFEKIAYIIVFTIVSYWIIEIKEKPFRIWTSEKYVMKIIEIDKNKYPLRPGYDTFYKQLGTLSTINWDNQWWFYDASPNLENRAQEWDQGYYEGKERDGYYYHSKFNTFPFIVWLLSGFIFSSILFGGKQVTTTSTKTDVKPTKDGEKKRIKLAFSHRQQARRNAVEKEKKSNHPSTQDKPTTE